MLPVITAVATEVRQLLQVRAAEPDAPWESDLECACAVAADLIQRKLRKLGLPAIFIMAEGSGGHCWTEVKVDGVYYAVDVTATQFSGYGNGRLPDVIVELREDYNRRYFLSRFTRRYRGHKAKSKLQEWPDEQQPKQHRIKG